MSHEREDLERDKLIEKIAEQMERLNEHQRQVNFLRLCVNANLQELLQLQSCHYIEEKCPKTYNG